MAGQKKFFLTHILFFFFSFIYSQKGSITGNITDAETRSPLYGATVNLSNGKVENTDLFGMFRLTDVIAGQYEIIVSHTGYKTEIIPVEVKENLSSSVTINMKRSRLDLSEVKLNSKKNSALNTLGSVDVLLRPVNNSQDVLRIIPGLFIAQHAGGGKAEQIFLRGYDIDHGTDIRIAVDGLPVNMVSHAHGQGYADLHFLIPETIEKVEFDKGPYSVSKGNLATAGYVDFKTKEFLKENMIKIEAGDFNTQRAYTQLKLFNQQNENKRKQFFVASEYFKTDGFVESPQNFHRFNILGKYNVWIGNQTQLTLSASTFDSKWNASGQIPERAVRSGLITRLGSIDDTEGGNTSRTNVYVTLNRQWKNNWRSANQLYYSRYHFNLYSNFTFFLEDDVNGDQIQQRETRTIFGYHSFSKKPWMLAEKKTTTEIGFGFRADDINDIALSKTRKRTFREYIQRGDVNEANLFVSWQQDLELSDRLTIEGGVRFDHFRFGYKNIRMGETAFRRQSRSIVSPKLNLTYTPSSSVKIYLNNGIGFHSNDARVILDNAAEDILPKVYGTDVGVILKPVKNLILKMALWHLLSEQEFVYVGDAGIVEPGGETRRMGIDVSARYQFSNWLFGDVDVNYTKARSQGVPKGEDYVPLAPSFTSMGGITAKNKNGLSGSLRYRLIADRPANETNTVRAQGYFILDGVLSYQWKRFELTLSAENILNREWREAQFDTESRLKNDTDPISEIHYTPGTPFYIKAGITVRF